MENRENKNNWLILILVVVTNMFVVSMPTMAMSVLSKQISVDLHLTLVQTGVIWGIGALPSLVTSLLGGVIGDKFGPKKVLATGCLVVSLLGALRGLAPNYLTLVIVVILVGAMTPFMNLNAIKTVGTLFPPSKLGVANGFLTMGVALGFLLGSMLSATVFSPLLGGWRNVFIMYGLIGALLSIPWFLIKIPTPVQQSNKQPFSVGNAIRHVAGIKRIWLLGFMLFGISGCIQSVLGYLPIYLRGLGWTDIHADSVLSMFHTVSMIFVLPIAYFSDRLGSRRKVLTAILICTMVGVGTLSFAKGNLIIAAVLLAGFVRDGCMALVFAMAVETKGVGPAYAGTAIGFMSAISALGVVLEPPIGNSLATIQPGAPFLLWAGSAAFGLICLSLIKGRRRPAHPFSSEQLPTG